MIEKLYKIFLNSKGVCIDTRKIAEGVIFFALKGENFNGNKFAKQALTNGASYAVVDEKEYALSDQYILVEDVLTTLQQLANYHRKQFDIPFIAVTGSNGKTTTKELLYATLSQKYKVTATKGNFNNHIGVPLTLLDIPSDTEMAIIEMGDNHMGEVAELCLIGEPTHGFITNIGKDHIEGFGNYENNVKAKKEIFDYLEPKNGIVFINENDDNVKSLMSSLLRPIYYGKKDSFSNLVYIGANPFISFKSDGEEVLTTNLIGSYNFENMQTAFCIAKYFHVPDELINKALMSYKPDNNRSQLIEKDDGNTIILDAYNANPSSVEAAVHSLVNFTSEKNKIIIVGDMFELGDISEAEHQNIIKLISAQPFTQTIFCGQAFYNQKNDSSLYFETKADLIGFLKNNPFKESIILVKGSRGMALEEAVEFL